MRPIHCLVVACALLLAAPMTSASPIVDPLGDVHPVLGPGTSPDIVSYIGQLLPNSSLPYTFTVNLAGSIAPPSAYAPNSIFGYIDLDIDKNAATGGNAPWGSNQPGGNSWINYAIDQGFLAGPPIALGSEYFVDLGSEAWNPGFVDIVATATNLPILSVPITFGLNSFTLSIPQSALGFPGYFNFGVYVGNIENFDGDRAPNGLLPAGVIPEPMSIALFGFAFAGASGYYWRRRRTA